ncbi:uncharacterized protein LOC128649240 [Bombina bombina]|uniref:uncharacterized protein LOC128649240 n=1 Tax=Bombina bombina TaxID=8345 RepID=UPI00235B0F70|nr:uncharacterized protein LOC128649240 [Bombina bombina]
MEALLSELLAVARQNGEEWIRERLSGGAAAVGVPQEESARSRTRGRPARRSRPPERLSLEIDVARSRRENAGPGRLADAAVLQDGGRGRRAGGGAESRPSTAPVADVIGGRRQEEPGAGRGRRRSLRSGTRGEEAGSATGSRRDVEATEARRSVTGERQEDVTDPPLELESSGNFEEDDPLEGTSTGSITVGQSVGSGRRERGSSPAVRMGVSGGRRRSRSPIRQPQRGGRSGSPSRAREERERDRSRHGRGRSPTRRGEVRRRLDSSRGPESDRREQRREQGTESAQIPVAVQQPTGEGTAGGAPGVTVVESGERGMILAGLKGLLAALEKPSSGGVPVAAAWVAPGTGTQGVVAPGVAAGTQEVVAPVVAAQSSGSAIPAEVPAACKEVLRVLEGALRRPCLCSVGPLGIHLTADLREKIGRREFVEIFSLLPLEHVLEVKEDEKEKGKKEEEERKKRWRKLPKTFANWSRAFRILASVFCEKFPEQGASLFCYYEEIASAFGTYGGMAWWRYDEGFRQRMAVRPEMRWDDRDMGIWLEMMTPLRGARSFRSLGQSGSLPGASSGTGTAIRKGLCFQFNEGQCKFGSSCKYKHECSVCGGIHSGAKCFRKNRGGNRPGELGIPGADAVKVRKMVPWLEAYANERGHEGDAELLLTGFSSGFLIPFKEQEGSSFTGNLKSAREFPEVLREKLGKEVRLGRMAGPFRLPPLSGLRVSPLGVVPKKSPGQFRMIHHLSFPRGMSVNDGIDPELVSVKYASFDKAISVVRKAGRGALLAKADVESAFRLLPVHPRSHHLLGCKFEEQFYVDLCLPMGCSISCSYFERFSSFVEWVVKKKSGKVSVVHYLDDFLFVGPAGSGVCELLVTVFGEVAQDFGIPISEEKSEGPVTTLSFLGIEIDSINMECRLPEDKVRDLRDVIDGVLRKKKVLLKDLQSLLGKLNFAGRIIPIGRIFCRRMSLATAGVSNPNFHIRLSSDMKEDLKIWQIFLEDFNGSLLIQEAGWSDDQLCLFTDASGAHGFGAFLNGKWCAGAWPEVWVEWGLTRNLTFLELFLLVVALRIWPEHLRDKRVCFHSDNLGVVWAINRLTANSPAVIRLLRAFVLECLRCNVSWRAVHVPGRLNVIADSLSRFQWDRFREAAPGADAEGWECPEDLWQLGCQEH